MNSYRVNFEQMKSEIRHEIIDELYDDIEADLREEITEKIQRETISKIKVILHGKLIESLSLLMEKADEGNQEDLFEDLESHPVRLTDLLENLSADLIEGTEDELPIEESFNTFASILENHVETVLKETPEELKRQPFDM